MAAGLSYMRISTLSTIATTAKNTESTTVSLDKNLSLLKPLFLLKKDSLFSPVMTLLSMLAGLQLFGIIGLFGFPITLSLLKNLNDRGVIHILK